MIESKQKTKTNREEISLSKDQISVDFVCTIKKETNIRLIDSIPQEIKPNNSVEIKKQN